MNIVDVEKVTKILQVMIQYELGLSDLYRNCATLWKPDASFWQNLADAEVRHADNIEKMSAIIMRKPEKFELGRPFNLIALNTAMTGIQDSLKRLIQGGIARERMLIMAKDIEQSLLESHYAEIVKTNDMEYQALMKEILSQTYEHKNAIQKKIEELKK